MSNKVNKYIKKIRNNITKITIDIIHSDLDGYTKTDKINELNHIENLLNKFHLNLDK